jgi:cobyrinic acid a,c-diamide synthase
VTFAEHPDRDQAIRRAAQAVADGVDLDLVQAIAASAPPVELPAAVESVTRAEVRIGYFADAAFSFYYPDNLECLRAAGAQLVSVDPATDERLPEHLAGLYIGGGFPEVHAPVLAENSVFAAELRSRVAEGLPVYAECGGLMYLAREIIVDGASYPMASVLDLTIAQEKRPMGHGYEVGVVDRENPFHSVSTELKGHEFHYSHILSGSDRTATVVKLERGTGVGEQRDGIVKGSVWASYLHLHAAATPTWADGFLEQAAGFSSVGSGTATAWA